MSNIEDNRKIVESIFRELDKAEGKIKQTKQRMPHNEEEHAPQGRRLSKEKLQAAQEREIVIDDDADVAEQAIELALEELDMVREAFLDFQETIGDLAIVQFIYPEIEEFVNFCIDLVELLEDDFETDEISGKALEQYQALQKLRARILSAMYMKYKRDEGE